MQEIALLASKPAAVRVWRRALLLDLLPVVLLSSGATGSVECDAVPQVDDHCEVWVGTYDHPGGHGPTGAGFDYAEALAVGQGSVFVTGSSWDEEQEAQHIATAAFAQEDGRQRWAARFGETGVSYPHDVAVSPDGSLVYVTGSIEYDFYTTGELVTVAYDAALGLERWSNVEKGPGLGVGYDVAVGPDGTVYVAGANTSNAALLALDGTTGETLWRASFDGPAHGDDQARRVAVSEDGSAVFVAGYTTVTGSDYDLLVGAYSAVDVPETAEDERGAHLWTGTYDGNREIDVAFGLGISPDGSRVFATGQSGAEGRGVQRQNIDYATVAFDARSGQRLWASRYAGPMRGENLPFDLAVSPTGDRVYVTGQGSGDATDLDWDVTTVAYDAVTGTQAWVRRYGFPAPCVEWGQAVAATATGVYVFGVSSANCFQIDLVTLRLDPATGVPSWTARFNDSGIANDWPEAIGLSGDGSRVFVAGRFSDKGLDPTSENLDDYGVIAYDA